MWLWDGGTGGEMSRTNMDKQDFEKVCKAVEAHLDDKIKAMDYLRDLELRLMNLSDFIVVSLKDSGQKNLAEYVQKKIEETVRKERP